MHEVITLQLGQQANYVGTHFWNAQESYFTYGDQGESPVEHDRSFRPGVGADGADTYTPRALIYDLKGAFGTLRRENELYELQNQPNPSQQNAWGRDAFTIRLPPVAPSSYQQALNAGTSLPQLNTDTVRFWSDYNHVYYHPRSLIQLNEYELNSSLMPFERYDTGEELFNNLDREHDILDRDLRPFLEECDQLQGIQLLSSSTDAWGGFAAKYLERIADELGKGAYWFFSLEDNTAAPRQAALTRLANIARTLASTRDNLSLYVPLQSAPVSTPAYLRMDPKSVWHTGALQASVIETLTLPTRLRLNHTDQASFYEVEAVLNTDNHRPLAATSINFLEVKQTSQQGIHDNRMTNGLSHDERPNIDQPLAIDLFPTSSLSSSSAPRPPPQVARLHARYTVHRESGDEEDQADDEDNSDDLTLRSLQRRVPLPLPVLKSFPRIIDLPTTDDKLACKAVVTSSERVSNRVKYLAHLTRAVLPVDEREALYDTLSTLAEEYEESMGFSDFSDDDD